MRWRPTTADRTGACFPPAQRGWPSATVRACAKRESPTARRRRRASFTTASTAVSTLLSTLLSSAGRIPRTLLDDRRLAALAVVVAFAIFTEGGLHFAVAADWSRLTAPGANAVAVGDI